MAYDIVKYTYKLGEIEKEIFGESNKMQWMYANVHSEGEFMLEAKDLEAIALLLDGKLEKSNEQMKGYIDDRFQKNNEQMKGYITDCFQKNNEQMKGYIDDRFQKNNGEIKSHIDKRLTERLTHSESFLLEEMERVINSTNAKIEIIQKKIDELTQYYRIAKLENDNTALLLSMITRLQEDVEELKKKTA